jgi:polar amino acid transport system substrate-binding protein
MRKIFRLAASSSILATVALWSITAFAQESRIDTVIKRGELIAGIRRDNPPHSFIDASGGWVGFDVDIAEAVAAQLGVKLKKVPVDELTRFSYLQAGTIDIAVASISQTWKRVQQADFSETYFWSGQTFLVRRDKISRFTDLVGKPVGFSRGSNSIAGWKVWLTKHGYPVNPELLTEFGDKQVAVQAVLQGAIAGWAEDGEVVSSYAHSHAELTILLDDNIQPKLDGIAVVKNDSKMRDAINKALQGLEKSGAYPTIYNRWFGPDTGTPIPLTHHIQVWPDG